MARMGKARLVEDVLRNRVGDQARGLSGARQPHRLLDRPEGRGGGCRIGLAGLGRDRLAHWRDRQRAAKDVGGVRDRCALDRDREPQALGRPAHEIGVAEEAERQADLGAPQPGLQGDLRADAGRVALCQGEDRRARAATASAWRFRHSPKSPGRCSASRWPRRACAARAAPAPSGRAPSRRCSARSRAGSPNS